jgi:16S rRNA (uracil1498-N3)-methyltransferase
MKKPPADDQYFFSDPSDVHLPVSLVLRGDEAYHCVKVLRKKVGDRFYAVNGEGLEFLVELVKFHKDFVECSIIETLERPRELSYRITLAQSLIKKDHFDLVAEKCTELGIGALIPVATSRSLIEPGKNKIDRWRKIMLTAMKQSRGSLLPVLEEITSFRTLVEKSNNYDLKILFHEKSERPFSDFVKALTARPAEMLILIGPEGGFTDSEVALAVEHGFLHLSLGQRRLRAETAAICAVSLFSTLYTPQNS